LEREDEGYQMGRGIRRKEKRRRRERNMPRAFFLPRLILQERRGEGRI